MNQNIYNKPLYVIPLEGIVIFPNIMTKLKLTNTAGQEVYNRFNKGDVIFIGLTLKQDHSSHIPNPDNFYKMGVLLKVENVQPAESDFIIQVQSLNKVIIKKLFLDNDKLYAEFDKVEDLVDLDAGNQSEMIQFIKDTVREISRNFQGSDQFIKLLLTLTSVEELMGHILPYLAVSNLEKQELFEMRSLRKKCLRFIDLLIKQKESIHLQIEMAKKFSERSNKNYRESLLREQLKAIQDELNEGNNTDDRDGGYKEKINSSDMPPEVKKAAQTELNKLEAMGKNNPESHIIRNYLDLLIALPWTTKEKQDVDIEAARKILDSGHYGLKEVKDRIIQHLAVMKLKAEKAHLNKTANDAQPNVEHNLNKTTIGPQQNVEHNLNKTTIGPQQNVENTSTDHNRTSAKVKKGSILLFAGPPGTGKTSLGKAIAEALGRKYVRVSLGGIRDEAEIRGHRRTYIGALPGRIIQGIKKAGEKNPVFVLDEVDKLTMSYSGDPASALLEVLDPEQNNTFSDHYLEVPYDLSDVFFIATANSINTIPRPLLDRMEMIEISSYTNNEKLHIGRKHLLPKSLEEHGLDQAKLQVDYEALKSIIEKYTREAGVRALKKQLDKIARVASEKIVSGKIELPWKVTNDMLHDILGKEIFRHDDILQNQVPGVVTGLAWTPVGGEILFIEGTFMPGKGELTLTGQLGDVMKESARISLSLIRSRLDHVIRKFDFIKSDIHIHVPSGATPKDGPSAGITLFTALASLILGKKVDTKLAMTGEITLRGSVLPVGGIKEKILAAHRAGIKSVILPKDNEKDLEDIPQDVQDELKFILVDSVDQVLKESLGIEIPKQEIFEANLNIPVNHTLREAM